MGKVTIEITQVQLSAFRKMLEAIDRAALKRASELAEKKALIIAKKK